MIWGKQDEILELSTAYKFQETLPVSELLAIEECGHVPHIEKPEVTADAIIKFVTQK